MLDYQHFKNHSKLIDANLNRQKKDVNAKAIQKIEFLDQLKHTDGVNADDTIHVCFNSYIKNK